MVDKIKTPILGKNESFIKLIFVNKSKGFFKVKSYKLLLLESLIIMK